MSNRAISIKKYLDDPSGEPPDLRPILSKDQARKLHGSHPVPKEDKARRQIGRLNRLLDFYKSKVGHAPEKQSEMFSGFIVALTFSVNVINMYRSLTKHIADIAEEGDEDASITSTE